jgi:hypothetical protein
MKKGLLYWYQIYNIYTDVKNTSLIYKSYWVINTHVPPEKINNLLQVHVIDKLYLIKVESSTDLAIGGNDNSQL